MDETFLFVIHFCCDSFRLLLLLISLFSLDILFSWIACCLIPGHIFCALWYCFFLHFFLVAFSPKWFSTDRIIFIRNWLKMNERKNCALQQLQIFHVMTLGNYTHSHWRYMFKLQLFSFNRSRTSLYLLFNKVVFAAEIWNCLIHSKYFVLGKQQIERPCISFKWIAITLFSVVI